MAPLHYHNTLTVHIEGRQWISRESKDTKYKPISDTHTLYSAGYEILPWGLKENEVQTCKRRYSLLTTPSHRETYFLVYQGGKLTRLHYQRPIHCPRFAAGLRSTKAISRYMRTIWTWEAKFWYALKEREPSLDLFNRLDFQYNSLPRHVYISWLFYLRTTYKPNKGTARHNHRNGVESSHGNKSLSIQQELLMSNKPTH
jgi:hypothetical protein